MGVRCAHCGTVNEHNGNYCVSCATKLPAVTAQQRPLLPHEVPSYQGKREKRKVSDSFDGAKKGSVYLFLTAGLALLGLLIMLGQTVPEGYRRDPKAVAVQVGLVVVLAGLAFWARRQPLPAAIIGLVFMITLWIVNATIEPESLARGLIFKVIILAGLAKAIQYGLEHRRLMRSSSWHD